MHEAKFININDGYERAYFKIGEHYFLCLQVEGNEVLCYDCNNEENEPSERLNATKICFTGFNLKVKPIADFIEKNNLIVERNEKLFGAEKRLYDCMFGLSVEQQLKYLENGEGVSVCLKNYDDEIIESVVKTCKDYLEASL